MVLPTAWGFARGVFRGIAAVAAERHVTTQLFDTEAATLASDIRGLGLMGVICAISEQAAEALLARWGVPCINISGSLAESLFPRVLPDNEAIGSLIATHLLGQRVRAYVGLGCGSQQFARDRAAGVRKTLEDAGQACVMIERVPECVAWLKQARKPIGVFAANDFMALALLRELSVGGVSVPDDVLVVGVDNDDLLCQTSDPPLSTVDCGWQQVGILAAQLLLRWVSRGKRPPEVSRVPPVGLIIRQSSNAASAEDALVNEALRLIRGEAAEGLTLKTLMLRLGVSRSTLIRRFQQAQWGSPAAEIQRVQAERACRLLADTGMAPSRVAEESGLGQLRHLRAVFKREIGMSPEAYRARFRAAEPPAVRRPRTRAAG